jgi:hypothetical protein
VEKNKGKGIIKSRLQLYIHNVLQIFWIINSSLHLKKWSSSLSCPAAHVSASSSPKGANIRRRRKQRKIRKLKPLPTILTQNDGRSAVICLLFCHPYLLIPCWRKAYKSTCLSIWNVIKCPLNFFFFPNLMISFACNAIRETIYLFFPLLSGESFGTNSISRIWCSTETKPVCARNLPKPNNNS